MINRKVPAVGLVLALALLSMSFKCNGDGGNGNGNSRPDAVRNAARAADAIAGSIKEMTTVKRELARQGKITSDEELKLTQLLLQVNTADKVLVDRLKRLNSEPDANTRQELIRLFGDVTTAVDSLNTNGVLGVTNEEARGRLTVILGTIRNSLQIISALATSQP